MKQRSLKQSAEIFYDPNYDIEKDDAIQSQINESLRDDQSIRQNDDVMSIGGASFSTH